MRKKLYSFFIIVVIVVTFNMKCVMGYQVTTPNYDLIYNEPLEDLQEQLLEISNEYISYNDNQYATINVTVTRKENEGGTYYQIGNGDKALIWYASPEDYLFVDEEKESWDIWLDVEYTWEMNENRSAHVQNVYLDDEGDFDPEKDGWEGQKALDGWIKEAGEVVGTITGGVGGIFNLLTKSIPKFLGGVKNLAENLSKNFVGTIFTILLDGLRFLADVFQILANLYQTASFGTWKDMTITYSSDYLYTDGVGGFDDEGSGNRDMYTKIAEYVDDASNEESKNSKDSCTITINGEKEGFTIDTPIPVIPGELYYVALGNIELLDINFLTVSEENHPDENSIWMHIRNFTSGVVHITIYIAAGILIIMLILYGIQIVGHTFDNPEERARYKKGLNRFATSLLMLVGTVLIMGLSIFGSKTFLNDIKKGSSKEGPIRINVESAQYSFSTTITGYFRYMSEIEDVDQYAKKASYTFPYVALVGVNFIVINIMFFRMLGMMFLAMVGPIIAALYALNINGPMNYETWVKMYVKLAFVQVILAIVYRIILKCIIIN